MLSKDILETVSHCMATLNKSITFVLHTPKTPVKEPANDRQQLVEFLNDITSCSNKLKLIERTTMLRSPLSFSIDADGVDTGISFSGLPNGQEFSSLILAVLHAGGKDLNLTEETITGIKTLKLAEKQTLHFESIVSLSCPNCPDIVQSLNQFAIINNQISHEMIDGAKFPELIKERDIQAVPSIFLNGQWFASGNMSSEKLLQKLLKKLFNTYSKI